MNRSKQTIVLLICDGLSLLLAGLTALLLRFDGTIPIQHFYSFISRLPIALPLILVAYTVFGLYNRIWVYASIKELILIVCAVSVSSFAILAPTYLVLLPGFPRSVVILLWIFNVIFVGGARLAARIRRDLSASNGHTKDTSKRTLIIGAGDAGVMLLRETVNNTNLSYRIVGFIDDNPTKLGYKIGSIRVLGNRTQLASIIEEHDIDLCIIAMPTAPGIVVREIMAECEKVGVELKTFPGLYEIIDGKVDVRTIRDVQIEDLLGRKEVKTNLREIAEYVEGQAVLITGAGGSIGSELCRQISRFSPKCLLMLGHGENSIYSIEREFREDYPHVEIVPIIADVQDQVGIEEVFKRYRPDVVFHAAAHKHVPLMEENPSAAIQNNVFGTKNVAIAADKYGVERFVLISTDKAVNPTSVMGSTKRCAEVVIRLISRKSRTKFMAVRFGNVLGSRGSVIPHFKRQIEKGGPVTVTHPDMERYFMTIPEAVQLVIQAGSMGNGGEVFVLDMGEPIKILDMARDLITLSGLEPNRDIQIEFTGIRPGEKLFEELLTAEEGTSLTHHEKIFVAKGTESFKGDLNEFLRICTQFASKQDGKGLVTWVNSMLQPKRVELEIAAGDE